MGRQRQQVWSWGDPLGGSESSIGGLTLGAELYIVVEKPPSSNSWRGRGEGFVRRWNRLPPQSPGEQGWAWRKTHTRDLRVSWGGAHTREVRREGPGTCTSFLQLQGQIDTVASNNARALSQSPRQVCELAQLGSRSQLLWARFKELALTGWGEGQLCRGPSSKLTHPCPWVNLVLCGLGLRAHFLAGSQRGHTSAA